MRLNFMRYAHIIEQVSRKPWAILPESHAAICALIERKLKGETVAAEREGAFGEDLPSMTIENGIAYIPVHGILARGVSAIEKSCGVCDYCDVESDIVEARNNSEVQGIVLDIDSPGGAVNGLYECSAEIKTASEMKPVVCHTSGNMCSAAYHLAVSGSAVTATPSSTVGSVGCIIQVLDESKAFEMAGYKMETFRSDPMKAIGARGTSLTDSQKEFLQAVVDEAANEFKQHVRHNRRSIEESALDGRVFTAATAKRLKLIDEVVGSLAEAARLIK